MYGFAENISGIKCTLTEFEKNGADWSQTSQTVDAYNSYQIESLIGQKDSYGKRMKIGAKKTKQFGMVVGKVSTIDANEHYKRLYEFDYSGAIQN